MFNGEKLKRKYVKVIDTLVLAMTLYGRYSKYYFLYFPNEGNYMSCPRSQN